MYLCHLQKTPIACAFVAEETVKASMAAEMARKDVLIPSVSPSGGSSPLHALEVAAVVAEVEAVLLFFSP